MSFDFSLVKPYLHAILHEKSHRYRSWEICREKFSRTPTSDSHALHLAFYLASWGMYRGSSGLLQKTYEIHLKACMIIQSEDFRSLYCNPNGKVGRNQIEKALQLKKQLAEYYGSIEYVDAKGEKRRISPTETLISKIMLGTLGCVPAFDRFFIEGWRSQWDSAISFNQVGLEALFSYYEENEAAVEKARKYIEKKLNFHYPEMKVLDMYFWEIGFQKFRTKVSQVLDGRHGAYPIAPQPYFHPIRIRLRCSGNRLKRKGL